MGSVPGPKAIGHSSTTTSTKYGTWAMKCIDCHHEHLQMQYWEYGPLSYFSSGVSDMNGITETTLTMTGAGWEPGSLVGMVLFPNIDDPYADWSNYGIVGNTSDTITVKGPMLLEGGYWDTAIGTGGKSFAVVYGNLINSLVPDEPVVGGLVQKPVRFFRNTGANSFADGDATYDGICEVCHTQTNHHRNDGAAPLQSHYDGARCTTCHPHDQGFRAMAFDHTAAGAVVASPECAACHDGTDPVGTVHGGNCGVCHVAPGGGGPLVAPYELSSPQGGDCVACHGSTAHGHGPATAGSGAVVLFADHGHDSAGRVGPRPYFDVFVECTACHTADLVATHGSHCATCHPAPRDTLGAWSGGCQQGGCHTTYHEDSLTAHLPYDDTGPGATNDCSRCHAAWGVTTSQCLNCHATYGPQDSSPPVTTLAQGTPTHWTGPAKIAFSIKDGAKVEVGRTFYQIAGGPIQAAGKYLELLGAGTYPVEFWSKDQSGNLEAAATAVTFTVVADTAAPVTTSNAQSSYNQGATITLTATDDGTLGVKATHFRLDHGPIQSGTTVTIPAANGTVSHTLEFWSVDWSGNEEAHKSVNFNVSSGTGTLRLVWGDSDVSGSPCPWDPEANAVWTVRRGGSAGPVAASGYGACPNWSGVNDIPVLSGYTHHVTVDWYDSYWGVDEQTVFPSVPAATPGQIVRLSY